MTRDIDSYKDGMTYEIFMHGAFKSSDNSKQGMHGSIIQNLVQIESGDTSFVKWHGSFIKQLEKIKIYMHKAMDKYLKMKKIPIANLDRLTILNIQIDSAHSSAALMGIISESIELTQCVKEN
ncbi:MAG: hypothetical protein WCI92_06880 [Bacteroidota bacterium]